MRFQLLALLVLAAAGQSTAQSVGAMPRPDSTAPADSGLHHSPLHYFGRSLLIPGWGQASLDRKLTAGLFIGFEGLAISMALKTGSELQFLDHADTATATSRRAERQDWIVLIAFNHLFSALEAYVSAHLIDFPPDLKMRILPGGRTGLGFTLKLPH